MNIQDISIGMEIYYIHDLKNKYTVTEKYGNLIVLNNGKQIIPSFAFKTKEDLINWHLNFHITAITKNITNVYELLAIKYIEQKEKRGKC